MKAVDWQRRKGARAAFGPASCKQTVSGSHTKNVAAWGLRRQTSNEDYHWITISCACALGTLLCGGDRAAKVGPATRGPEEYRRCSDDANLSSDHQHDRQASPSSAPPFLALAALAIVLIVNRSPYMTEVHVVRNQPKAPFKPRAPRSRPGNRLHRYCHTSVENVFVRRHTAHRNMHDLSFSDPGPRAPCSS